MIWKDVTNYSLHEAPVPRTWLLTTFDFRIVVTRLQMGEPTRWYLQAAIRGASLISDLMLNAVHEAEAKVEALELTIGNLTTWKKSLEDAIAETKAELRMARIPFRYVVLGIENTKVSFSYTADSPEELRRILDREYILDADTVLKAVEISRYVEAYSDRFKDTQYTVLVEKR